MGTELGYSDFSLGSDAQSEFRLVAPTCPQRSPQLSPFSDRSRSRLLSDLRVPVATPAEQKISATRLESNVRADWWPRPAFPSPRRFRIGKFRSESARRGAILARGAGRIGRRSRDWRRPRHGAGLCPPEFAFDGRSRLQYAAMGICTRSRH